MNTNTIGIYPGSFDPWTLGHQEVLLTASHIFDEIHVVVGVNENKTPMFIAEDRVQIIQESMKDIDNWGKAKIVVCSYSGLIVNLFDMLEIPARIVFIIRGIRSIDDVGAEFHLLHMNETISKEIPTVREFQHIWLPKPSFVSSSDVRFLLTRDESSAAKSLKNFISPRAIRYIKKIKGCCSDLECECRNP